MKPLSLPLFITCLLGGSLIAGAAPDRTRPNIILIMVDDMGYSDIGAYGADVPTPNPISADPITGAEIHPILIAEITVLAG